MPQTKHMRKLGCFSIKSSPADMGSLSAAWIIALSLALDKPLWTQLGRGVEQSRNFLYDLYDINLTKYLTGCIVYTQTDLDWRGTLSRAVVWRLPE
jgi:hypothetical protein